MPAALGACSRERPAEERAPLLECASQVHDFGAVPEGPALVHTFELRNRSRAPLVIQRVEPSYSCAGEPPAAPIVPGGSAALAVSCRTDGRPGRLADVLTVHSNAPGGAALELEVRAEVTPALAFETTLVRLSPEFGGAAHQDVYLKGGLARQARLAVEAVSESGVRAELLEATSEKPAGVRLSAGGARVGRGDGHVLVSTGLPAPSTLTLPYSWVVAGHLQIEPDRPYVNLREPGRKRARFAVRSTRPDFELRSVEVKEGPLRASLVRSEDGRGYAVEIEALSERLPQGSRGRSGAVVLISNDPQEPRKEVPIFAFGLPGGGP